MIPEVVQEQWLVGNVVKATVSKPRVKAQELRNIYIKQIKISGVLYYSCTYRYATNDQVHNYLASDILAVLSEVLRQDFYNLDVFTHYTQYTVLQSRKGKVKLLTKKLKEGIILDRPSHDHKKQRLIPVDRPWLVDLGIVSSAGKVYATAQSKYRQINRYVELVSHLLREGQGSISIADMGSGKGYLTFALHDYLVRQGYIVTTQGIEMRPDLVHLCNTIAQKHAMEGLSFVEGSIDTVHLESTDMVIALHACDIATDMAIAQAVKAQAQYIVLAPCCHKQIRRAMVPDTVAKSMLKHGILLERQAEMVTDAIRSLLLESRGYKTSVIEWISAEHTGKNIMITAMKTGGLRPKVLEEVEALKSRYGIDRHYLEDILPEVP